MAQSDTPKTKQQLDDETALLEAQRARDVKAAEALAAATALATAQRDADPTTAARKKQLADERALLDVEKENLALRKANSDAAAAQIAAEKAQIQAELGSVPDAPVSKGGVTVNQNGGKAEATLLAARATAKAAAQIATQVPTRTEVVIVGGKAKPLFDEWDRFDVGRKLLGDQFARAGNLFKAAGGDAPLAGSNGTTDISRELVPLAVGTALESLAKLGQFFQTEYTVSNLEIGTDDDLLVAAVGQAIKKRSSAVKITLIDFNPAARPAAKILPDLNALAGQADIAIAQASEADRRAALLKAAAEEKGADKADLQSKAAAYERAATALRAALTAYDSFSSGVMTVDTSGRPRLVRIAEAKQVVDSLAAKGSVLFVHMHSQTGGFYTKKNLWTFLGGMPFRVMGGVVVSYTVIDGSNGAVSASGIVPVHGGYRTVSEVEKLIDTPVK